MNAFSGTDARPVSRAWHRSGWISQITEQIDSRLAAIGIRRTGPVREVRRWSLSAVLALPTTDNELFFKQSYAALDHEGLVLAAIGGRTCGAVPEIVGSALRAEGWLTRGVDLWRGSEHPPTMRGYALAAIAAIQRRWLGRVDELSELGCWDRRPENLASGISALLGPELLGASSGSRNEVLSTDEYQRLTQACDRLPSICDELATAPPGNTLVHGDLHPGNWGVAKQDGRLIILDWAEATIGHPFYDIAPALRSATDPKARSRALAICLDAWDGVLDRFEVLDIWRIAEPVGILNQLLTYAKFLLDADRRDRSGWRLRLMLWARLLAPAVERAHATSRIGGGRYRPFPLLPGPAHVETSELEEKIYVDP